MKHILIRAFHEVLERRDTEADDLLRWSEGGCPGHVLDIVLHAVAVKRAREHRFREAADILQRAVAAHRKVPPGCHFGPGEADWKWSEARLEAWTWLAGRSEALDRAAGPEERGAILYEMGRKCFRDESIFAYPFLRTSLFTEDARWDWSKDQGIEAIHPGNHYRHASEFFARIVEECPEYGHVEEAEYSIPLCLWRIRKGWPNTIGHRLERAIHEGFQTFADRHPHSSMADEALYLSAIHHMLWSHDDRVMMANAARLRAEYSSGNILAQYGHHEWLREGAEGPWGMLEPGAARESDTDMR